MLVAYISEPRKYEIVNFHELADTNTYIQAHTQTHTHTHTHTHRHTGRLVWLE